MTRAAPRNVSSRCFAPARSFPETGAHVPTRIDTICLHGDTPEAVAIARALRAELEAGGLRVARFDGMRG